MLTLLHPSLSTSQINMIKLPQKHTSSVAQLAQMAHKWPGKKGSPHQLIKSKISAGISGWDYSTGSTTTTTPIWTRLKHKQKIASTVLLCMRYDAVVLGENLSKEILWEISFTMCQRLLWKVIGQALSKEQEETPISTLRDITKATSALTLQPNTKMPYSQ